MNKSIKYPRPLFSSEEDDEMLKARQITVLNARLNSKRRKEKQEGLFLTVGYTSP
jgi:hypothetical protein